MINWDDYEEEVPTEIQEWMAGDVGGSWEWEGIYSGSSIIGKRKKRKNPPNEP